MFQSFLVDVGGETLPTTGQVLVETIQKSLTVMHAVRGGAAVLVQPYVKGQLSGVIFTSDPTEGRKGKGVLTFVAGPCSALVDGTGEPSIIPIVGRSAPSDLPKVLRKCWHELIDAAYAVELDSGYPVDCEFTIDSAAVLFMLQSRPIAGLTAHKENAQLVPIGGDWPLPAVVLSHPKIQIRLRCQRAGVPISRGWIATQTEWTTLTPFGLPIGCYTSVLIHPHLLDGKVRRLFSPDGFSGASALLAEAEGYWVRHAFVAEVIDAVNTGVASRQGTRTVVEIAKGHFVPKGLVDTSVYELHGEHVTIIRQAPQRWFFGIDPLTGEAVRHEWDGIATLSDDTIRAVANVFSKLGLGEGDVLEFGVDRDQDIYVIDIQTSRHPGTDLSHSDRVISAGECEGDLVIWKGSAVDGTSVHFFEFSFAAVAHNQTFRPVVVAAERPDIQLIKFLMKLAQEGQKIVGMIFRVYSPLCHLALLLREAAIPAVVVDDVEASHLAEGLRVRVEATSDGGTVRVLD